MKSHALLAVLLLVTGCAPRVGVVAELSAPAGVSWHKARVQTAWATKTGSSGHDVVPSLFPSSYEMAAVEVVFDDTRTVVLESRFTLASGIGDPDPARAIVQGPFVMANAPNGAWIAVSGNGGATWRLVEPNRLLTSAHLVLPGPLSSLWTRAPTPVQLAAEILRRAVKPPTARELGDVWLNDVWEAHPPRSEAEQAATFALDHPLDPLLQSAALEAFQGLPDNVQGSLGADLTTLVTIVARQDPAVRKQLQTSLEQPSLDRVGVVVRATDVLIAVGDAQVDERVAAWAERVVAQPEALTTAFHDPNIMIGWSLTTVWWGLARRSFARGRVDAATVTAARDWLTYFASKHETVESVAEPLALGITEQGAACYAAMLLGLAGDRSFLASLPRQNKPSKEAWPPTFSGGSVDDGRTGPYHVFNLSGWIEAAIGARSN